MKVLYISAKVPSLQFAQHTETILFSVYFGIHLGHLASTKYFKIQN